MSYEHVVFDRHSLTDEGMTGDLYVLSNAGILLNLHKRADSAAVSNRATIKVDEAVNLDIVSQLYVGGNPTELGHVNLRQSADEFNRLELLEKECTRRRGTHCFAPTSVD